MEIEMNKTSVKLVIMLVSVLFLGGIAKAGLAAMTRILAKELAPNVRVNGVSPGAILWPETDLNEAEKKEILSRIALQRNGDPLEIAKAVNFLVEDADYITGQIITVDGGRTLFC